MRVVPTSIGDAVITTDTNKQVTFMKPGAELLTGWSYNEVLGQRLDNVLNLVCEEARMSLPNRIALVLRNGAAAAPPREAILISKNSLESMIEDTATPVRDSHDVVLGTVLIFRDLAEHMTKL